LVVSFTDRAEGHLVTGPKVGDPTGPSSGSITHESRAGSRKDSAHIPKEIAEFSEGWTNPKVDNLVVARALRPNSVFGVAKPNCCGRSSSPQAFIRRVPTTEGACVVSRANAIRNNRKIPSTIANAANAPLKEPWVLMMPPISHGDAKLDRMPKTSA
jgi:hypothetical protein